MPTSSATSSRQKATSNTKRLSSGSSNWHQVATQQAPKSSSFVKRSSQISTQTHQQASRQSSSKYLPKQHSQQVVKTTGSSMSQPSYRRQETFQVANQTNQGHFCVLPSGPNEDEHEDDYHHHDGEQDLNNNNFIPDHEQQQARQTLSLSGQSVLLTVAGSGQHLSSLSSLSKNNMAPNSNKAVSQLTISGAPGNKSCFLVNNSHFSSNKQTVKSSNNSLQAPGTTTSSTAQLNSLSSMMNLNNESATGSNQPALSIQRSVSLKHIKSLIILLMAVDLLITVFVHQFSTQDQLNLWLFVSFKMRFSLLNLILSAIWFAILIGAILFEVYPILLISCLIDIASLVLLLVFSIVHFSRRIDYNNVQLTSLLALLFSIVVLHVYLIVLSGLMVYLTLAVKRRQKGLGRR